MDYHTSKRILKANGNQPIKRVHTTDKYHRYCLIDPDYDNYHYLFGRGKNNIDYIIQIPMPNKAQQKPEPKDHILYD